MRAGTADCPAGRALVVFVAALALAALGPMSPATAQAQAAEETAKDFSGSELTPTQKLAFAQSAAADLSSGTNRILGLIEEAQRRKDVLLLNCLNDKLIALRGLLKVADDSRLNLQEAIARENFDQQEHNYRKVAIADDQSKMIIAEAEACVGDLGYSQAGGTIVSVTVEGEIQTADEEFGSPSSSATRPEDSSPDT